MATPKSGKDSGEDPDDMDEGLDDLGVRVGVRFGGVPLRRRKALAFGRKVRFAYEARLSCKAYVTKRDNDRAFSPLKLMCRSALKASTNSGKVCGVKLSPFRASVKRFTTPAGSVSQIQMAPWHTY